MSAIVVEPSVVPAVPHERRDRILVVPRPRRRDGSWDPLRADDAVEALERAGSAAVVLVRPASADPGAVPLAALARMLGREVVRLPDADDLAAWVVGVAIAGGADLTALQALAGAAGPRLRRLRPPVLLRWGRCAWRPCPRCPGGGVPGAGCGRCGSAVPVGS